MICTEENYYGLNLNLKVTKIKQINIAWIIFGITILLLMSIILPGLFQRYAYYSVLANHLGLPYELNCMGN